jgi:hypothetical protein
MGVALRYYAENLNSTEFGFYYQKTDSRLPYVSYRTEPTTLGAGVVGWNGSQVARGASVSGCAANLQASAGKWLTYSTDDDAETDPNDVVFSFSSAWYHPNATLGTDYTTINDPDGLIAAYGAAVTSEWDHPLAGPTQVTGVASTLDFAAGAFAGKVADTVVQGALLAAVGGASGAGESAADVVVGYYESERYAANSAAENEAQFADSTVYASVDDLFAALDVQAMSGKPDGTFAAMRTALGDAISGQTAAAGGDGYAPAPVGTVAGVQEANCAGTFAQMNTQGTLTTQSAGHPFDSFGQLQAGSVSLGYTYNLGLFLEHPEVETYGMSFNTVIGGWGVQGDFTFRPDAPLQIDTDELTIRSLFLNCAAQGAGAIEASYMALSGYNNEFGGGAPAACYPTSEYVRGYVEHDVTTWDIGTTATFTRSNPLISAIGADIGILLTEFQGVQVDGAEDRAAGIGSAQKVPLSNVCTSGSDLPLASILNIDVRPAMVCRPTDHSMGMVLLARAQYNNVFGTPIGLAPTVVFSEGLDGYSPSPIGSWREGVGSTAFSLGFSYLGSVEGSVNYVTYHGDDLRTKDKDREHLSVSLSYAF